MDEYDNVVTKAGAVLLLSALLAGPAIALAGGAASIGVEVTIYPGRPMVYAWNACQSLERINLGDGTDGTQCVDVPGYIIAMAGTSTLKTDGEVLSYVTCNGVTVWQGNHRTGTVPINVSGLDSALLGGRCFVSVQTNGAYATSAYELQLTFFYK